MILSSNGATFEGYAGVKRQQPRRCTSKREHDSVSVRIRLKSVPAKHDLTFKSLQITKHYYSSPEKNN